MIKIKDIVISSAAPNLKEVGWLLPLQDGTFKLKFYGPNGWTDAVSGVQGTTGPAGVDGKSVTAIKLTTDESGRVTAKKSGKVAITYKAKNYDVERTINVLIFDKSVSTKLGDVDGDGIVDILDLVKLRRHVAGVEALQ